MYIPLPIIDNKRQSLYDYTKIDLSETNYYLNQSKWFNKILNKRNINTINKSRIISLKLYEKGFSSLDIIKYIKEDPKLPDNIKWNILIYIDKLRKEFRNEKYLMLIILNIYFMRKKIDLENIISI